MSEKYRRLIIPAVIAFVVLPGAYLLSWSLRDQDTTNERPAMTPASTTTTVFESPFPTSTAADPATPTVEPTWLETDPAVSTLPVLVTPTAASIVYDYPESFYIVDITGHRQVYPLGCEASVAVDWMSYFGVNIYEYDFQVSLPLSDNPDYGFVGDVYSVWGQIPPYAYGVYSGPVADLMVEYGVPAQSVKGYTLDEVKQKLSDSKPIIAWVIGNMVYSEPIEYIDAEGRSVMVAPYEHVVILTGYNETSIRYMTNGRFYDTPTEVFLTSWGVLGNMAVVHE